MIITPETWPQFSVSIATDGDPTLRSPAAIERFGKVFGEYIVNVKAPHGKFKAINRCQLCQFPSEKARMRVDNAWNIFLEKKAKSITNNNTDFGRFEEWVALGQFQKAAELEKAEVFAEKMYRDVQNGKAAGCALRFKGTIARCVKILVTKYGVSREQISLIWGGMDASERKKRLSKEDINRYLVQMSQGIKVSRKIMLQLEIQLTETESEKKEAETDYGQDLQLGSQSLIERQREIDKFQSGKSHYCFFTYAAGGVGLSLHHAATDPKGNPIVLRQRVGYLSPVYSPKQFVQGLGRLHRSVFSCSNTDQTILFFADSVEEGVMLVVSQGLRCLKKVIASGESWESAIYNPPGRKQEDVDKAQSDEVTSDDIEDAEEGLGDDEDEE